MKASAMKAPIGAEIRPSTVRRVLDMREPLIPRLSSKRRHQAAAPTQPRSTSASQTPLPAFPWYRRPWPWRKLFAQSLKLGVFIGLSIICLSLRINLAEHLIGIYGLAAILYSIDSQRTFLIALIFLLLVAVWSILGQSGRAEIFAVYAFYFLVIGLFCAFREMKNGPQA